jgi:hypothetical protein
MILESQLTFFATGHGMKNLNLLLEKPYFHPKYLLHLFSAILMVVGCICHGVHISETWASPYLVERVKYITKQFVQIINDSVILKQHYKKFYNDITFNTSLITLNTGDITYIDISYNLNKVNIA